MKKILGLIGIILTFALICAFATGCDKNKNTTDPQIPGIGTSDSTTDTTDTGSTTDTSVTTDANGSTGATNSTSGNTTANTGSTSTTTAATTDTSSTTAKPATTTTGTTGATSQLVIFLDPGHGGSDPGTVREYDFDGKGTEFTMTTYEEEDINLDVALKVKEKLEALGYKVVLSRTDDTHITVADRVAAAANAKANMFISIHVNSADDEDANGFEVFYRGKNDISYDGKAFADLFTKEFTEIKDIKNEGGAIAYPKMKIRGTKADTALKYEDGLGALKEKSIPSVLLELGFLSNYDDAYMLQSKWWQGHAAQAIADAVVAAHTAGIYKK